MNKVLFIDAAVRPQGISRTRKIADRFMRRYVQLNPEDEIQRLVLGELELKPHTWQSLQRRDSLLAQGKTDDDCFALARQFAQADKIVICAPFWDLSFPANFKIYIENVSVGGITFGFDGNRMYGLCRCKKLMYITTRGGDFASADAWMESALPQLKAWGEMFSFGEISCICAEGIDLDDRDGAALVNSAAERAEKAAESF